MLFDIIYALSLESSVLYYALLSTNMGICVLIYIKRRRFPNADETRLDSIQLDSTRYDST